MTSLGIVRPAKTLSKYADPDEDSDKDFPSAFPSRPLNHSTLSRMEAEEAHYVPRPVVPIHRPPSSRSAPPHREFVDLTETPSPPPSSSQSSQISQIRAPHRSDPSKPLTPLASSSSSAGARVPWQQRPIQSRPLGVSASQNQPYNVDDLHTADKSFGSSISKRPGGPHTAKAQSGYGLYIKPATPNAFKKHDHSSARFDAPLPAQSKTANSAWPSWVVNQQPYPGLAPTSSQASFNPKLSTQPQPILKNDQDENPGEVFDINVQMSAEDAMRHQGDADEHMRELLSGAIGDGEDDMGDDRVKEGEDTVEGFAKEVRLMPHQVRGVRWMRGRETGRKYGGILADDMGLGKTVQTLARIVEGVATAAEKKAGHKGGTLIIAPLAVMEQWAAEVKNKTQPGLLKVTTHHGPSRTKVGKTLEKFDVVITTFQTLASEHGAFQTRAKVDSSESDSDSDSVGKKIKKKTKKAAGAALFEVKWLRVVVDEAQNIKNRRTNAAKAAVALRAKYRWCLTGTPIQNNVEELFSLFEFLRARPLDDWDVFRSRITSLVKDGRTSLAMKRLHVVLKAIMLRRTKDATIDGKPILNLPGRKVDVVQCPFDNEERAFYTALEQQTTLTLNKFLAAGTVMSNYTSVLTMLLRMRQACDHPTLVTNALTVDKDALESKPAEKEEDQADELADLLGGLGVEGGKTCQVCFVKLQDPSETHCAECIIITRKARAASVASDNGLPPDSAKIRMLLKLLGDIDARSQSKEKTIVFSQFTSFLNLIEPFLRQAGIKYVRYDGAMKNDKRQESLEKIKTSPDIRLILISFKAGSTGLNLTCCNNVILMDLWWNPALEDQAFDRAHRLGQKLDVNIFKLTISETVEDRILTLQDMKRELAKAALSGKGAKNLTKLTLNDIMALFKVGHEHEESDDDSD